MVDFGLRVYFYDPAGDENSIQRGGRRFSLSQLITWIGRFPRRCEKQRASSCLLASMGDATEIGEPRIVSSRSYLFVSARVRPFDGGGWEG